MSLASLAIRILSSQSAKRFETATSDPVATQTAKLRHLMQKNAGTEYGKRHGFADINSFETYRSRVPVITYEDIKEDMQRVVSGAQNIFTAEDPVMFAQTSGTTGDPKYVPVTPTCQGSEHKDVMRTWMSHALRAHPDMFAGQVVTLVSPAIEGHTTCGLPYGSTSGHMYKNQPGLVRRIYAIPYEVYEIEDYAAKYFAIMRTALEMDIRFLATANPSSILKLCEKADEYSEQIIRDIHDGTLSSAFDIEPAIRPVLSAGYKPNPQVARQLEAARGKRVGQLLPVDYWPRLSLIGCWKGGTVGHYLEKFPAWFDPDGRRTIPVRDWGYLSSEARGSIPLSDEGSAGVLTVASNIFEFVPVAELEARPDDPAEWPFLHIGEIEEGQEYYIFFTTTGGLYRYDINDVIKVVGFYNKTPQIVFLRKGRGMTNLTGEKVSVNQVIDVMQSASRATGAVVDHFRAEADMDAGRYLFRVEFATRTDDGTRKMFLEQIDEQLKAINIEYKAKRDSLRLGNPVMHVMREGWYERGRQQQVEAGMRAFQAKTQLLSPVKEETVLIKPELEAVVEMDGPGG
ncbi:MAG: GH3 auxin-responsive promoter family protein [Desulfuromonadales bacterium]